jgi:hypothetical protein
MAANSRKDWRELCAEAAIEPDSERLVALVNQILHALDECDQRAMAVQRPTGYHGERH